MDSWPRIALDSPIGSLLGRSIAVGGIGPEGTMTVVYAQPMRHLLGIKVALTDTGKRSVVASAGSPIVPADMTLAEVVLAHADLQPTSAGEVPRLKWRLLSNPRLTFIWMLGVVALLVLAVAVGQPSLATWTLPAILGLVSIRFKGRTRPERKFVEQARVYECGRSVLPGEVWRRLPPSAVDPASESLTPTDRVTVVKEAYGSLRTDVLYRIENSALFDGAFAPTQRFEIALLAWDPASPDAAGLAKEVEKAFAEARSAAEDEGFSHLPETARDTARRAQGAARTALRAGTGEERLAAGAKAAQLLRSLALYYLPSIDPGAPKLVGAPKQIEPAS